MRKVNDDCAPLGGTSAVRDTSVTRIRAVISCCSCSGFSLFDSSVYYLYTLFSLEGNDLTVILSALGAAPFPSPAPAAIEQAALRGRTIPVPESTSLSVRSTPSTAVLTPSHPKNTEELFWQEEWR